MFFNNGFKIPPKPDTPEEQLSALWDIVTNHIVSWIYWQNVRQKFILTLLALILALIGICIGLEVL